jgi:hypothetical protein
MFGVSTAKQGRLRGVIHDLEPFLKLPRVRWAVRIWDYKPASACQIKIK